MKYRGYYIDHVVFHSKADIDQRVREDLIERFKTACGLFLRHMTVEAAGYSSACAEALHRDGMSWTEIEALEIEFMSAD